MNSPYYIQLQDEIWILLLIQQKINVTIDPITKINKNLCNLLINKINILYIHLN